MLFTNKQFAKNNDNKIKTARIIFNFLGESFQQVDMKTDAEQRSFSETSTLEMVFVTTYLNRADTELDASGSLAYTRVL